MKAENHLDCPIEYEWFRCSSKEYGLSCDTCCHYDPSKDAAKVKLEEF